MPEWEINAIKSRIEMIQAQREEAAWLVEGMDIAYNGEEEDDTE
jgi:hypothetical protein